MDTNKIGKFIAENRKKKNMTQQDLANLLNVGSKTISRWETGRHMPDLSMLIPLSEEIGVSVHELLLGEYIEERELNMKTKQSMETIVTLSEKKKKRDLFYIVSVLTLIFMVIYMFAVHPVYLNGNIKEVDKVIETSQYYTAEEINEAMNTVTEHFETLMTNCTLMQITYGDVYCEELREKWIKRANEDGYTYDKIIPIRGIFKVGELGSVAGLEKDKIYNYYWIVFKVENNKYTVICYGEE